MATPHENNGLAANGLPEVRCPLCQTLLCRMVMRSGTFSTLCQRCSKANKSTVIVLIEIVPKPLPDDAGKNE